MGERDPDLIVVKHRGLIKSWANIIGNRLTLTVARKLLPFRLACPIVSAAAHCLEIFPNITL
jgi:hypothetical protein